MQRGAVGCRRGDGLAEQRVVRDGGERAVDAELVREVGVRARARTGDDVHQLQIVGERTGRADADDVVNIVEIVQLPAVDADRRDAHAGGHHGHGHALPRAGVALHAADVIDEHGIFKEGLGDELRAQRVAGHEHGLGDLTGFGFNMRRRNRHKDTSVYLRIFGSGRSGADSLILTAKKAKVKLQRPHTCGRILGKKLTHGRRHHERRHHDRHCRRHRQR